MPPSIYWYDLETTGTDSILDRPIQFAGVRTDEDLNVIGEPLNLFCRMSAEVVPSPDAILVTGIRLKQLVARGMTEVQFCHAILEEFQQPQSCVTGFNSIRFDDEFMRQMLYRNFFEPYAREWQGGNSRWDVIDLFRMAHALRPEGIQWVYQEGLPSFRLELLTEANGISHTSAHDAVSDVLATIALTRKLKEAQPRLYQFLFSLRNKKKVLEQLYPLGKSPIVHVSSMYSAARHCVALVLPLCTHPTNSNGVVCFDLSASPDNLISASPEELHRLVFSSNDELDDADVRIPLKTIHINRSPAIAPRGTLSDSDAERLGIDLGVCEANFKRLQQTGGIVEKVHDAFALGRFPPVSDPDYMLYPGNFFSARDVQIMSEIRRSEPSALSEYTGGFDDERLDEMLFRFRARNFSASLSAAEENRWRDFCRTRLDQLLPENKARLAILQKEHDDACLEELADWYREIES